MYSISPKKATTETKPAEVPLGEQLSQVQKQELRELVGRNQDTPNWYSTASSPNLGKR